jgi:phospholipid N-methyltransferase
MRIDSSRVFYRSAAKDFRRTGAIAPSSSSLGRAMTRELVRKYRGPANVLEVGGGTGCITKVIAQCICSGDRLDIYEIDSDFSALLNRRLAEDHSFDHIQSSVCVFNEPIECIDRNSRYDFIISCLPFTNFQPAMVREIFEIYRNLLNPGGVCSFFEYILIREAARFMRAKAAERRRVAGVAEVVGEYVRRYSYRRDLVFRNLPPAMVHHLCFSSP